MLTKRKIRFFQLALIALLNTPFVLFAQDEQPADVSEASKQIEKKTLKDNSPIIRLEDTIRGNKEQPQVLTIVPWQLPFHKDIDEPTQWQPLKDTLPPIDRRTILRSLEIARLKRSSASDFDE